MSQKNIAAVLLLIATALGGPVAIEHAIDVQEQVVASVEVNGPTEVEVGELVILKINGDRPSWIVPVDDAYVLEDVAVLSFRKPGEHEVIGTAMAGSQPVSVRHTITVGTPEPIEPEVQPTPVEPVIPTPVPDELKPSGELTASVYNWCVEANADKRVCKQLGDNFIYAASNSESIDELLQKVSTRNRKVNQRSVSRVLAKIQQHLYDELAGEDFDAHQCAFDEIGQGFLRYAEGAPGASKFWHGT